MTGTVDILQVRFPRLFTEEAVAWLLQKLASRPGTGPSTGVCFPDMSTLNLAAQSPALRRLLQQRMTVFPDGAGLAWVAKLRGKPLPANLNGTDLVPRFLSAAKAGTTVFLLGGQPGVAQKTTQIFAARFPHLCFVGHAHGYLSAAQDEQLVARLRNLSPRVVLVGLGNPQQIEWICRRLEDPVLRGTMFLAVGGQFDYYGGSLRRAPALVRRARLEWLWIVLQQPHKLRRYFLGIPLYLSRCAWAGLCHEHDLPQQEIAGKAGSPA